MTDNAVPGQAASDPPVPFTFWPALLPLRGRTVAVTGASGALGTSLLRALHGHGAELIALSTASEPVVIRGGDGRVIPLRNVVWCCGQEQQLEATLRDVDILVINHGVNVYGDRSAAAIERSLEVNALSAWRLLELFLGLSERQAGTPCREVWVNTSEAELLPALSPLYEISKRLLGQLLSLRALDHRGENPCRIRRLVLGPFSSSLNPYGVMGPDFVAGQVIAQARRGFGLIIVTPNPITVVLVPLQMWLRHLYGRLFSRAAN